MKPARFDYVRPGSLDEVLSELAKDPYESKILAGGQSLIPMMNFRLARPERLIDINDVPDFEGITVGDDQVVLKTRTRHLALQNLSLPGPLGTLLRKSATQVGHLPIRTRGTFGGSIAHCDAASEWCLIARLLDAKITVTSLERGPRTIDAADFFLSIFTTAMEPDEVLTEIAIPKLNEKYVTGMAEFARRAGDFAIVAATAAVEVDDGVVSDARVCIGGVSEIPFRSDAAESVLNGAQFSPQLVVEAAEAAADQVDPPTDAHGDAEYRRDLVRALVPRALGVARS